jgi:hypothetical protein
VQSPQQRPELFQNAASIRVLDFLIYLRQVFSIDLRRHDKAASGDAETQFLADRHDFSDIKFEPCKLYEMKYS